jgi:dihydrofolate synthase / folylpolyglutamate synthase
MLIKPIKTRIFKEGENLFEFICKYFKKIPEKSVIVVTSKIVALSERRTVSIENIKEKEKLIKRESQIAIPTKYVWLTIKDGMAMSSAGIDESNADGKLILLPKDSFKSASSLRKKLMQKYEVKDLGIVVTDSSIMPLRAGVVGAALGHGGFRGIKDYRRKSDIFGRQLEFSSVNIADSLAASAVLLMGEGREKQPLAIIEKAPIEFCDRVNRKELIIAPKDDMYFPLFSKLLKK